LPLLHVQLERQLPEHGRIHMIGTRHVQRIRGQEGIEAGHETLAQLLVLGHLRELQRAHPGGHVRVVQRPIAV
jgi:hypothetical protein